MIAGCLPVTVAIALQTACKKRCHMQDKKFHRACAEGREVHDRRLGKTPATKHRPHDFLHPGWSDDSDDENAEDQCDDLRPLPVTAEKLQDCSAEQALSWLYSVACTPMERPKVPSLQPKSPNWADGDRHGTPDTLGGILA